MYETDLAKFIVKSYRGEVRIMHIFTEVYHWPLHGATFSKEEIGLRPYSSALVAVRKSVDRLEKRGLIRVLNDRVTRMSIKNYYVLTDKGEKLMQELSPRGEQKGLADKPKEESDHG